jgi:hypothetical protein
VIGAAFLLVCSQADRSDRRWRVRRFPLYGDLVRMTLCQKNFIS